MPGLPVDTFVQIATEVSAGGTLRVDFGTGLLVTVGDTLPAGGSGKVQAFRDLDQVNDLFPAGDVVDDAAVWFARSGIKSLYIGRWATADVPTTLRGGTPAAVSSLSVANAAFSVAGVDVAVDLSSATTYAGIATAIQNALASGQVTGVTISAGGTGYVQASTTVTFTGGGAARQATGTVTVTGGVVTAIDITDPGSGYQSAPTVTIADSGGGSGATATATLGAVAAELAGATFVYDTDAFLLTLSGADALESGAFGAAATGTDISAFLGMTAASGANYKPGHDEESLVDAIGEMVDFATSAPVALMLGSDTPDTHNTIDSRDALAAYAQAGDYIAGILDTSAQALVTGDDTSHLARVFANQQDHVVALYSKAGERPDIGMLALLSSQTLNLPQSIITTHLKRLPNVEPSEITETQRLELERKRANAYTTVGGIPRLIGGYSGRAGIWADTAWWLMWLKNELETNIINAMGAAPRFNTRILEDVVGQVMRTAVQSGGIQPGGRVSAAVRDAIIQTTGNAAFDGIVVQGYLSWFERSVDRSDLDRENRIGRFRVWAVISDALHRVVGTVTLSN